MKSFEAVRRALGPTANAKVAVLVLALSTGLMPTPGFTQLSSPIAGSLPGGSGAGVHSPNSPFAPLPERADVLPWSVLTDVKTRKER
jgi:hypothetical protein